MNEIENNSRITGRKVFWAFISFFVVFVTVDVFFIYKAVSTHPGVVAENAYEIGLNYNKIIDETKKRNHDAIVTDTNIQSK